MSHHFHQLSVSAIKPQGTDAVSIEFEVPHALLSAYRFSPGQYLTLRTNLHGSEVRRPYSICSRPGAPLRVGVRAVPDGRLSSYVCGQLAAGDTLDVMPPQGRFGASIASAPQRRVLLLAAGSGITPVLSIADHLLHVSDRAEVTLVYGNRSTATIMFHEELDDLKNAYIERFRVVHLLSREQQDIALLNGRIEASKLKRLASAGLIEPLAADGVYICGPGNMIDSTAAVLRDLGVDDSHVHAERFEAAPDAAPARPSAAVTRAVSSGAHIEITIDGVRRHFGVSDPNDTVLSAATRAGLDLPYSCTGGMCATCRCKVVRGSVEMATNYALEPWELKAGFVLGCQARPTSDELVLDFDAT